MIKLKSADRHILETVILPWLSAGPKVRRILFVGCAEYTAGYERYFAGHDYYTIDVDPSAVVYGAGPGHHFVDSVEHADSYFKASSLHAILLNGVFGYGLDDAQQAEKTVALCHDLLVERGVLIVGWNDLPQCKPFEPLSLLAWARFDRLEFDVLAVAPGVRRLRRGDYLVDDDYQHVFSFFEKLPQQCRHTSE
jgi:hypothetical protein